MKRQRKFCENQVIFKEDWGKGTYTCLAHFDSGRVFKCSYKESQIKVMDEYKSGKYRLEIQHSPHLRAERIADGICRDFEINAEVKRDLIAKVVSELEKS